MKFTTDSPVRTGSERSKCSAPSGLALRQRNGARRSGGSDSGRISKPYSVLAKLKPAATQNGSRGSMPPSRPPTAGPRMKPAPKADADLAEHRRALLRRRDVGDIGECRRDARRGDARDHPADEQPDQRRRQRHQHIVERQPEIRQQHHRPPAEPVRQAAEDRREEKLHQRPDGAEQAEDPRRARGVVVDEAFHQLGQDRHDQAEREHVEQNGDEDEGHRAAARRRAPTTLSGAVAFAHDGRLRLCANGLAFSRSVIRTGVPGSSKNSRSELTR